MTQSIMVWGQTWTAQWDLCVNVSERVGVCSSCLALKCNYLRLKLVIFGGS